MTIRLMSYFRGPDPYELHLQNALADRGFEVHVVCDRKSQPDLDRFDERIIHHVLDSRKRFDRRTVEGLRSILSERPFDLLHAYGSKRVASALRAVKKVPHRPKVVATRGYIGNANRFDPFARFTFLNKRLDHIVCVSQPVEEYLHRQGVPRNRLSTVYLAWDPAWVDKVEAPALPELGVPDNTTKVVFVGNAAGRKSKGLDVLLDAWRQVPADLGACLVVVGRTDEKDAARARGLRNVHFLGFRTDAPGIMKQCDVYVMPSRAEAFGKALVEAMLAGLAPVVTDSGAPGVIVRDRRDGLVVPKEDPRALAGAIARLVRDPGERERMSVSSRQRARDDFSLEPSVRATIDMYHRVLGIRDGDPA